MTNEEKLKVLQGIIDEGLGDRTRRAFAFQVGMTPEHLSRMMKKGYSVVPNQKILFSFAANLPNTSKDELLSLFEMKDEEENDYNAIEMSSIIYRDLRESIDVILSNKREFDSLGDFLDAVMIFNKHGEITTSELNAKYIEGNKTYHLASIHYQFEQREFTYYLAVGTYPLPEEGVLISNVFYSQDDLETLGFKVKTTTSTPFACLFSDLKNQFVEQETVVVVEKGIGFYTDNIQPEVAAGFIANYKGELSGSESLETIAKIINERTKLKFDYILGKEKSAILCRTDEANDMINSIVQHYAKELQVDKYGYISVLTEVALEEDELFDV